MGSATTRVSIPCWGFRKPNERHWERCLQHPVGDWGKFNKRTIVSFFMCFKFVFLCLCALVCYPGKVADNGTPWLSSQLLQFLIITDILRRRYGHKRDLSKTSQSIPFTSLECPGLIKIEVVILALSKFYVNKLCDLVLLSSRSSFWPYWGPTKRNYIIMFYWGRGRHFSLIGVQCG